MKSLMIALPFIVGSFMPTISEEIVNFENAENEVEMVRVTCGTWVGGIYYQTSAGNIFTSASSAADKCVDRLTDIVANAQ